jgi:hypothetical protein
VRTRAVPVPRRGFLLQAIAETPAQPWCLIRALPLPSAHGLATRQEGGFGRPFAFLSQSHRRAFHSTAADVICLVTITLKSCGMWIPLDIDKRASRFRRAQCPTCNRFVFCGVGSSRFDCYGFEVYDVDCGFCQTPLIGVIDPSDEALLLSVRSAVANQFTNGNCWRNVRPFKPQYEKIRRGAT